MNGDASRTPDNFSFRWPQPFRPEDEEAFWSHRTNEGVRSWHALFLVSGAFALLTWPTDRWLYARTPEAIEPFAIARVYAAASAVLMYLLLDRVPFMRARPILTMSTVGLPVVFVAAWQFGRIGGPTEIWFHFTHLFVLAPIVISMLPWKRVLFTVMIALSLGLGLFGMHPEHLSDPVAGATMNWMLFLVLLGIVAGLFADGLRRREFFQRCEAIRLAEELDATKNSLERQVETRTREVRELARHLESAREEERTRIARDLHDDLGQELTALRYAVELTKRRVASDPTSVGANVDEISALMLRTRQTLRSILSDLRPRVLDDLGFVAASAWLIQRTRERTGLTIEFTRQGLAAPPPGDLATTVYRVLQEALSNVVKHAWARKVDVRLDMGPDAVVLEVVDDGVGFSPADVAAGRFGLVGMRERAAILGGVFEVEAAPERGTTVRLTLPVPRVDLRVDLQVAS